MAAYAIFFILFTLVLFGVVYVCLNYALNELLVIMNSFIVEGSLSTQFVTFWQFVFGAWKFLPLLFLFALIMWAVVRALERKQEGGL
jgi:type II secretory pathway component PulF